MFADLEPGDHFTIEDGSIVSVKLADECRIESCEHELNAVEVNSGELVYARHNQRCVISAKEST